jgi:phospholipase C
MSVKRVVRKSSYHARIFLTLLAIFNFALGIPLAQAKSSTDDKTRTPIKHVIVIIGENRTFDHVFATYQPVSGDTVSNLLSKGIVDADGTPVPNASVGKQNSACDTGVGGVCPNTGLSDTSGETYQVSPDDKALYAVLPAPLVGVPLTFVATTAIASIRPTVCVRRATPRHRKTVCLPTTINIC